jgi:hypothetical protein
MFFYVILDPIIDPIIDSIFQTRLENLRSAYVE